MCQPAPIHMHCCIAASPVCCCMNPCLSSIAQHTHQRIQHGHEVIEIDIGLCRLAASILSRSSTSLCQYEILRTSSAGIVMYVMAMKYTI